MRDKWIHIKVSEAERLEWQAQAKSAELTLADFIRRLMKTKPHRRASRRADPVLLATLGRIGNNLNQVARWANTYKSAADAVQVCSALMAIEQNISDFRPGRTKADEEDGDAD